MIPVRLLLNAAFSGANCFFSLADARGLFRRAGLNVQLVPGRGAWTAAARLREEGFDAAYGDLNALIELAAFDASVELPMAVCLVQQQSPCTISVARAGPINGPADLAGRTLVGHASDVALRLFPAYANATGVAGDAASTVRSDAAMAVLLKEMLAGRSDGVFGFVTTHVAALACAGLHAGECLRFLPYRAACPYMYGSALMVAPRLIRDHPDAVTRLVQALRDGIVAARQDPEAALDAMIASYPVANRQVERERWIGTLTGDIACPPGTLGEIDAGRLHSTIQCLSSALGWPSTPDSRRFFTPRFLGTPQ